MCELRQMPRAGRKLHRAYSFQTFQQEVIMLGLIPEHGRDPTLIFCHIF
jgi:hypothetical protein